MASFFKNIQELKTAVTDFAQKIGLSPKPYDVQEIKKEQLSKCQEVARDECLTLFKSGKTYFNVLYCPNFTDKAYSLYQVTNYDEALANFTNYSEKLKPLYTNTEKILHRDKLQVIVDLLRDHPTWTCAHIAAKLNLQECFRAKEVLRKLNTPAEEDRTIAVHIAVQSQFSDLVRDLVYFGASLSMADAQGDTIFHYAAKYSDSDTITILSSKDKSCLNQLNIKGESALHVACAENRGHILELLLRYGADPCVANGKLFPIHLALSKNSLQCVEILLKWGREEQLSLRDNETGGTPLHWCKTKEAIYTLSKAGAPLDLTNSLGCTALHHAIQEKCLTSVMGLLVAGANGSIVGANGNSCLHYAVQTGSYELVQCAIVFGADVNYVNHTGHSARHMAAHLNKENGPNILYAIHKVGGSRCSPDVENCAPGCQHDGTFNGEPRGTEIREHYKEILDEIKETRSLRMAQGRVSNLSRDSESAQSLDVGPGERVLCLDGGGIRGLVTIQILMAFEQVSNKRVKELFDWISGTSTGGILALGLARGRSARQVLSLYFKLKDDVFKGRRPYDSEPLELFLKQEFGEQTRMSDIQGTRVLVTGVLADRKPAELHLFRNYEFPGIDYEQLQHRSEFTLPPRPHDQLVWRAARSSGAAPTYFRAFGRFLDGGLMSNNPTLDTMTEIHDYTVACDREGECQVGPPRGMHVVVSLGTGRLPLTKVDAVDIYRPEGVLDLYKNVMGAKNLGEIIVEAACQSDGRPVERAAAWCSMVDVPFYRFSPNLTEDVPMDCTDDATLINMLWETQSYIASEWDRIRKMVSLLDIPTSPVAEKFKALA